MTSMAKKSDPRKFYPTSLDTKARVRFANATQPPNNYNSMFMAK